MNQKISIICDMKAIPILDFLVRSSDIMSTLFNYNFDTCAYYLVHQLYSTVTELFTGYGNSFKRIYSVSTSYISAPKRRL